MKRESKLKYILKQKKIHCCSDILRYVTQNKIYELKI